MKVLGQGREFSGVQLARLGIRQKEGEGRDLPMAAWPAPAGFQKGAGDFGYHHRQLITLRRVAGVANQNAKTP